MIQAVEPARLPLRQPTQVVSQAQSALQPSECVLAHRVRPVEYERIVEFLSV